MVLEEFLLFFSLGIIVYGLNKERIYIPNRQLAWSCSYLLGIPYDALSRAMPHLAQRLAKMAINIRIGFGSNTSASWNCFALMQKNSCP
jgi:hypothetical protein